MANFRSGRCLGDDRLTTTTGTSRRARIVVAATLTAMLPGLAWGQSVVRRGSESVVNSFKYGTQRRVDVASNSSGEFVVVWQTFYNTPNVDEFDIQAQRFAATGARQGGEIDVTVDPNVQDHASVGVAADG